MTGADQTKKGIVEQPKPMLTNKKFVEKLLGIKGGLKAKHLEIKTKRPENKRDRRLYYGAWYIDPDNWHQRLSRQLGKLSKILHIVIPKMYIYRGAEVHTMLRKCREMFKKRKSI